MPVEAILGLGLRDGGSLYFDLTNRAVCGLVKSDT